MQKILRIAQREYIETVKTKMFIAGVLMTPVIIGIILLVQSRLARDITGPRPPRKVAVADLSEKLSAQIKTSFDEYNTSQPERQILLEQLQVEDNLDEIARQQKDKVRQGQLDAYVVLDKDVVEGAGKIRFYTYSKKMDVLQTVSTVGNLLNGAVVNQRCKLRDVSAELIAELRRRVPTEQVDLGKAADQEQIQSKAAIMTAMMVPFFFMFMIFAGILGTGQHMLSSVIEEKNSRVIEVLLSAVSPFQLMAGKVIGLACISLTVIGLWGFAAYAVVRWQGMNINIDIMLLLYFPVYYVLGFVLLTSILAGIGSVCNTIKESQSLMMPVTLVFIIPMMAWFYIVQHPEGTLARVLSFIPPITPMVMVLRLGTDSEIGAIEILASIAVLAASVPAAMWAAAKVFRTGILMYGKRPGPRELLRWLRQS